MFQFGKYPMDILEMLSGHQAHQFKGLGLERQLQHQQQVQLQHQQQLQQQQQQGEASGALLSGLGLGSLQGSRSNAFSDSSSIFAKMGAPPPPIPQQTQSSSSQSSRKSSKMSSSGSSASGYPQFLRPFHPAEAALAQEQLHSGMGRFDFAGGSSSASSGVIGGVVTSAPPPPPLHPGLSVPQPSPGPSSSSPSPSSSTTSSNNPASSSSTVAGLVGSQPDARSLHQQFSCMLAANQYFLSGMPANASLEQFLVQQGPHNHLGLADSNTGLAPPPALHPSHTHGHPTPQPQQQQQQLPPHALSHPHSHAHPHHPLHPAPQPSPLSGFDFQGIPVLSSNQLASLMQQEAGLPLPLPLHLSAPKDDGKGDGTSVAGGSGGSGSRRKKAMAGYLPQRKTDGSNSGSGSSTNCHSSSGAHGHDGSSGLVGGGAGVGMRGLGGDPSSILSSSTPSSSSSTVSSSSSSAPSSNSASVLVTNVSQIPKTDNQSAMTPTVTQPEPEPLYHCGECGKSFTHLPSLRRHIRSHEEGGNDPNSSVNTNPNTVHQHQSDTSLPHSTQDGISQQNAHHQHEPNQSNPDPSSSCPSPDKTYCCNECGKGFKKRGHLLQHGVIHSGARPYACSTCERSFNRRESLTRHEKIHEDKPYRCPACDRCFRESTSLLNHAASGSCGKPGRGSSSRSSDGSSVSSEDKVEGSEYQGGQLGNEKGLGYEKAEEGTTEMTCDGLYPQGRGGNPNTVNKPEGKYNSAYSRDPYQATYRVDDYRRQQGNLTSYSGDGSCSNMSGPALRKAPLAPTLHPHPPNQQQHHHHQQQPHLPLSSLLDDSEDEVTSSAMSAIAAAAAASVLPPEMNNSGGREERRDIIGGLLGGLGFGSMGGPSSTSAENGGNEECLNGSMMPLSHPAQQQQQHNSQNATSNAKPKRPRKPRQKREPRPGGISGEGLKRRRSNQNGARGDGSERPYLCTVCGRGFGRRETLRRHERVHTGEKPFHCDVCGKDFREPFHLTKHQTVHSGEKNYKCSLCGKDFGYAQSLKRHEKLHLRGDFKPRRSKTKSSASQGGTVTQDGSQTNPGSYYPYPQDKAQGSSASTSNQPPPKLYTCEICWKSFRHHFHLTAHHQAIHEHGGEKLFSCEVCGKAFAYSNSLTRHRLSQHGLARTGPTTQPTGSGSGGNAPSLTESEAATNALLNLAPESGGHGVQQTHSTIAHTQHLHSQPAGYSPLFYTPESGPHSSNTNAPSHTQHPHYSHSTVGPLSHQQPVSGKGQQIYPGVTGNPIHSAPPHIHISSSSLSQYHQHSFQMQPQHLQHQVVQVHGDVAQKKPKKKKKKFKLVSGGQLIGGFSESENARWHRFLRRKKSRLQQQLRRKTWITQLKWAKYTGGIGINLGVGTWCVGGLKFKGLRSLMVPLRFFTCPICPSTTFTRRITHSVHRVIRHPPRRHGCRARLRCIVCGKRSRRLLSALRHRARHLSQGSFSCPQCPSRFWNGALLQRHKFACRRVGGGQKMPKGTYSQKGEYYMERSGAIAEYRH